LRNLARRGDEKADADPAAVSYMNRMLKPAAAELVKKRFEATRAGKPPPTPSSSCWPMVAPYIYRVQEMQLLQSRDEVLILYMQDHEVRRVRLNGTHPARVTPSWHGDSVGHYEGDTLVVDTVSVKVGPVSIIDPAGSPYSEALHVVERYRLIDGEAAAEAHRKHGATYRPFPPLWARHHRPGHRQEGPAGRVHRGGPRRFHHALVGTGHLSAPHRGLAGSNLRRESVLLRLGWWDSQGARSGLLSTRQRRWRPAGG
jgi:hypothetical protein